MQRVIGNTLSSLVIAGLLSLVGTVQAAIPASERAVLLNLYTSTNGASWTTSINWNDAAGTECTWYGVSCDGAQTTVTGVDLSSNNLAGSLPSSLNNLTNLQTFKVNGNQLTGSIPTLTGLASLSLFWVGNNQLTGPIPALAGLTSLGNFAVNENRLTGSIPALTGLANLYGIYLRGNNLSGSIPALTGLTNLHDFNVQNNRLTGNVPSVPIPNSLTPGHSYLCPNFLNDTPDSDWDAATGQSPWYTNCVGTVPPPTLQGAGSRKAHGAVGTFDLPLSQ